MNTKIYVGNLPFSSTEEDLRNLFSKHGTVTDIHIISDKLTGRSRGFGFVTMESAESAKIAIEQLNGQSLEGRDLTISEARPRPEGMRTSPGRGTRQRVTA